MGAVIELVGMSQSAVRTAVTGLDGRFQFVDLTAGTYKLRASASFLRPVTRGGVRLAVGLQAVVNLTLADIYDAGAWLPMERRHASDAEDDWAWTMRSAASRPVLRLADPTHPSKVESTERGFVVPSSLVVTSNAGRFGASTAEEEVIAGYRGADGALGMSGAGRFGSSGSGPSGQSVNVRIGVQRQLSPYHRVSTTAVYGANSRVQPLGRQQGMQYVRIASADQLSLGDTVRVEVGGLLASDPLHGGSLTSEPFARVLANVVGGWSVEYTFARDRSLQSAVDADPVLRSGASSPTDLVGRVERGRHDAAFVSKRSRSRSLHVAWYRDDLSRIPLTGSGTQDGAIAVLRDLGIAQDALFDHANGLFRAEGPGFTSQGCSLTMQQRYGPDSSIALSLRSGSGLEVGASPRASHSLHVSSALSVGVSTHSRVHRTGTDLEMSYQWQPERLITPIDAFDVVDVPAYLGFRVQQLLPRRLALHPVVLSLSASNLLRQGMHPVPVAGDQESVTLAQELPTLQGGLGFSF